MPKARGQSHYNWKHGLSGSKLHFIWIEMRQRCGNRKHKQFPLYGARGVRVCPDWKNFNEFYKWAISNGYQEGLSIHRRNNDGDYEPSNCKWATQKEQTRNTIRSKLITYKGETKSLCDWAEALGVNYRTLRSRLRIGWPTERAFETPILGRGHHRD